MEAELGVSAAEAGEAAVQAGEEQEVERGEGGQEHQGGHPVQQGEQSGVQRQHCLFQDAPSMYLHCCAVS